MRLEDEIIEDSEDEELFAPLAIPRPTTRGGETGRESARAALITLKPADISSALSGAASASAIRRDTLPAAVGAPPSAVPAAPSGRPRPRPAYKGKLAAANEGLGQAALAPAPIAPSTSTTKPTNLPATGPSTTINPPTTSTSHALDEDASMYSLDIAERAKLRSRARSQKTIIKPPVPLLDSDVIEISSDDDLNIRPAPKANKAKRDAPSPRKRTKHTHTAFDLHVDDASSVILPIATSNPSSQLPPSDPPPSTPPSSTPANALPIARASSPLSPPIPPPPRPPKRKRKAFPEIPNDFDDDGVGHRGAMRKERADLAMPPPPPPFFPDPSPPGHASDTLVEGSSSTRASDIPEIVKPSKAKGKRKVVNNDDFEDEWPVDPLPKPRPRSRKTAADEEDWQGDDAPKPARKSRKKAAADDEDEDEWAGDAPKKRKPRAPPKKKGQKEVTKQVVEVVIEQRSPKKGASPRHPPAEGSSNGPQAVVEDELSPLSDPEAESRVEPTRVHTPPPPSPKPPPAVLRDGDSVLNSPRSKSKAKAKGKKRVILDSDEEENDVGAKEPPGSPPKKPRRESKKGRKSAPAALEQEKEKDDEEEVNEPENSHITEPRQWVSSYSAVTAPFKSPLPASGTTPKLTMTNRSYTIGGGRSSLPMSELLKKVNSQPGSPFSSPRPTYSPYAKSSKSLLRKIAPLHPNRRTPPPPPPRPPAPKKSKKQLELEEKWEMELEESVEGWYCMPEEERAALRRAKRDAEMGFED